MNLSTNFLGKKILIPIVATLLLAIAIQLFTYASASNSICDTQERIVSKKQIVSFLGKFPQELPYVASGNFSEGFARIRENDSTMYHFIDRAGNVKIKNVDSWVDSFTNGLALSRSNLENSINHEGFIDKTGNLKIPYTLDTGKTAYGGSSFREGLYAARINGMAGFIDHKGKWVIPAKFEDVNFFAQGVAAAKFDGKWGFINSSGVWVIPPQYEQRSYGDGLLFQFSEGLAGVRLNDKVGYIDLSGKFIIPPQFQEGQLFSEGLAAAMLNDSWGYIDTSGAWLISPQFKSVRPFSEGLAGVQLADKRGSSEGFTFINAKGELAFSHRFENVGQYSEGLAPVMIDKGWGHKGWGYIDYRGKLVIPSIFQGASNFSEGVATLSPVEKSFEIETSTGIEKNSRFVTRQDISKWLNQCEAAKL